jgi:Major tropism determinant N-terminal domain
VAWQPGKTGNFLRMEVLMSKIIRLRNGPAANCKNFVGFKGEPVIDTDNWRLYVHDGVTLGGHQVASIVLDSKDKSLLGYIPVNLENWHNF